MNFVHPSLKVPLDDRGQIELLAALVAHRADQDFVHEYTPKESCNDPFVRRQRKAARGGVGR